MSKILDVLKKNNPEIVYSLKDNEYKIENVWNDESISLKFKKGSKISFLQNLVFPEQLFAVFHKNSNKIEFIYSLVDSDSKLFNRSFDFIFRNENFKCFFAEMSQDLKTIAASFVENNIESATDYRNLRFLRDVLTHKYFKNIFKKHKIASFTIEGNFENINFDFVNLSKSLNFYMTYFDRDTPKIIIYEKVHGDDEYKKGCFYELFDSFPKKINSVSIDATLLDTFMVANLTDNVRLKFIFYFQILEYSSYY